MPREGLLLDLIQAAKPWLPQEDRALAWVWGILHLPSMDAGRPASGGRKKSRCPFLGAQVCTYLRWGDLQGRFQGTLMGARTFPSCH